MATQSGRPPDNGPAARLQETRRSRSSQSSQTLVVTLATVAAAAVIINGRFHGNINAEVAPRAQVLRDETIGMGADAAHPVAFDSSGFTTRNVSAQTELVTQRGHDQRNASSAGSFTASSSSTNSSSIAAPDFITRGCIATSDKGLISPSSKALQSRSADGGFVKIEGGGSFRLQTLCTIEILFAPDTTEGKGSCEIPCDPPHIETTEGKESREILYAPLHVETTSEGCRLPLLPPLLHSGPVVLDERGGREHPPSSTGGDREAHSPATPGSDCSSGGATSPSAHRRGWWGGLSLSPQVQEWVAGGSSVALLSADGTAAPPAHRRGWWGESFLSPQDPEGVAGISSFVLPSADGAQSLWCAAFDSSLSRQSTEGVAGGSSFVSISSVDDTRPSFLSLRHPEGVVGESPFGTSSSVDDDPYSFSCLRTPEGVVVGESLFASSCSVDGAPYSFLPSVAHGGGGGSNDLPDFCDVGGSGGLGVGLGRVNYFHLPVTSLASVPYHIDPPPHGIVSSQAPAAPPWEGMSWIQRGGGEAVPVAPVNVFSIGLDSPGHDACMSMSSFSSSLRRWAAPTTTPNDTSMQDCLPAIAGEPTETRTLSASGHRCNKEIGIVPLREFTSPWLHEEHDVTPHLNVYANYNDFPMTTCDNSTIDGTVGRGGIAGFYAYRDIYDEDSRDDAAMKIYLSACNGHEHDYALLGYFCACSQNFDFTAGYGIYSYNLLGTTLDDAVVDDSGRKDLLNISTLLLLWTASIAMVAAFVLCLSTTTSTTIKVGVGDISTGLVEVFGMIRINLLEERNIFERKSGSATTTTERDNDCEFEDACPSTVLTAHSDMGGMRMDVNRILYMTSFLLTCSSDDPLSRYVFQCLVRSSLDHRAESHRVCSAAPVMTKYGQQSRVHARASSHSSLASLCHRSFQDQFAWSSRACLSLS